MNMKFEIMAASIVYGGGTGPVSYHTVKRDVTADYVRGFFENLKVKHQGSGIYHTPEDSMGCYTSYKVVVTEIA
jgi:hypothetical protein